MNRIPTVIAVLLVCVLAVSGCSRSERTPQEVTRQTPVATPLSSDSGSGQSPSPKGVVPTKKKGVIYVVSATGGDDNNLIAKPVTWEPSQTPALAALNTLAHTADSPLPTGTEVRGVKIVDGLATVDLSREFQSNFHGGDTEEAQTVNSILLTLGQFPSIDRVQILVEGRPIEALSQLPISAPLDVIRPGTVRQAQDGRD